MLRFQFIEFWECEVLRIAFALQIGKGARRLPGPSFDMAGGGTEGLRGVGARRDAGGGRGLVGPSRVPSLGLVISGSANPGKVSVFVFSSTRYYSPVAYI